MTERVPRGPGSLNHASLLDIDIQLVDQRILVNQKQFCRLTADIPDIDSQPVGAFGIAKIRHRCLCPEPVQLLGRFTRSDQLIDPVALFGILQIGQMRPKLDTLTIVGHPGQRALSPDQHQKTKAGPPSSERGQTPPCTSIVIHSYATTGMLSNVVSLSRRPPGSGLQNV